LPRPALDEEGEEIDPRDELVRRLIEYRKFKEIAQHLRLKEEDRRLRHARPVTLPELAPEEIPLGQVSVFDLLTYLKEILERTEEELLHTVQIEPVTLEERMEILRARLAERPRIRFSDFLQDVRTRIGIVVSFMALLEVMKDGEAIALQDDPFTEIFIARREPGGA